MIPVLFSSHSFVIVHKPAGMLSVPSRMGDEDLRPVLGLLLQKQLGEQLWPVHRLDFEVEGLIVFARNPDAHQALSLAWESSGVKKTYLALTEGLPDGLKAGKTLQWESKLLRGKKRAYANKTGKEAITEAEWLGTQNTSHGPVLRWKLHPLTGRSHQLRWELAHHGYPIVGDTLYGSKMPYHPNAIGLCAVELHFTYRSGILEELPEHEELDQDDFKLFSWS